MSILRIEDLETPAAIVDLDILEKNFSRLMAYAKRNEITVRTHTKTHKIPAFAQMQIASGCVGITVAKSAKQK